MLWTVGTEEPGLLTEDTDMAGELKVGTARIDITPPAGTALAGSTAPRTSVGVEDPLNIKAIVIESGKEKLVYVILDLIALNRADGDRCVALASERAGISPDRIVWAASHTHTGPYSALIFGREEGGVDEAWMRSLPDRFAECVAEADAARIPVRVSRLRAYAHGLGSNRRLRFKDGRELNVWLLGRGEDDVQCVGSAGPVDPEVGMLAFDDERGDLIAVVYHYTLHTNTNFGERFSADYPAVVDRRIRAHFGDKAETLFVPGACGDVNTVSGKHEAVGSRLADAMIPRLDARKAQKKPVALGSMKRDITVPYRDLTVDQEERIRASQWAPKDQEIFRAELKRMREAGETECRTVLQAWRIGDVGFASLPGELFCEWGLKIKQESPFDWTYPVELGGDYIGYLVTEQAWRGGGYESLIARSAKPSHEGVAAMVDEALDMLRGLHGGSARA